MSTLAHTRALQAQGGLGVQADFSAQGIILAGHGREEAAQSNILSSVAKGQVDQVPLRENWWRNTKQLKHLR